MEEGQASKGEYVSKVSREKQRFDLRMGTVGRTQQRRSGGRSHVFKYWGTEVVAKSMETPK